MQAAYLAMQQEPKHHEDASQVVQHVLQKVLSLYLDLQPASADDSRAGGSFTTPSGREEIGTAPPHSQPGAANDLVSSQLAGTARRPMPRLCAC